ncbi:MAG TPA: Hsp70 family protein, partial [Streptosporangiaceae bacterium]|nr:Hsp70 family protein [Streptosporangiaceae bacterium]
TGKEQSVTISGGSALPKEDIQRMMAEAEKFAEEDRQRREEAEARNQGDTLAYTTEKFLAENAEKIPGDIKTEVEDAVKELKEALKGTDIEAIKAASEKTAQVSQKMGTAIYAQSQSAQNAQDSGAAAGDSGQQAPGAGEDEVVDAEIVDEGKDKRDSGAA